MGTESASPLYLFLVQTVEQACAMSPGGGGDPAVPTDGFAELVSVDFSGPTNGRMLLALRGRLLPRIAGGFLDGQEILDRDHQIDALKELANILCGNLLPSVGGSRAMFKIAAPRCLSQGEWALKPGESLFSETAASYENGEIFLRVLLRAPEA